MAAALALLLQYKFNKWVEVDINKLFIHLLWFDEHYSIVQCELSWKALQSGEKPFIPIGMIVLSWL